MTFARKFLLIATLLGLAFFTQALTASYQTSLPPLAESTFSLGFLLLFAFLLGRVTLLFGAPMITGFLIAGVLAGPFGLSVITPEGAEPLRLVDNLALALIAFSAGGELKISKFRHRIKALLYVAGAQSFFTFAMVFTVFFTVFYLSGFVGASFAIAFSGALLLGVVAMANSPATAMAVITETRSRGPVSETIIGVTVLKDVMVIAAFGLAISVAQAVTGSEGATGLSFAYHIMYDIAVSLFVGSLAGLVMISYLRVTSENVAVFVLGLAVVVVEVCQILGIGPLLACIVIGFIVENYSKEGEKLIHGLDMSSLPIFVIFFSLTGHGLDVGAFADVWFFATLLVVLRMTGTYLGSVKGLKMAGENESIGGFAWTGFIGQAGVSLGFAMMISKQFPEWGAQLSTLIIAVVVVNQLVGPVLMKRSLIKAGEAEIPEE